MNKKVEPIPTPTNDEVGIVKMLSNGAKGEDIEKGFGLQKHELSLALTILRSKYGCKNSTELVAFFIRNKLID